jgi:hypothetical protein
LPYSRSIEDKLTAAFPVPVRSSARRALPSVSELPEGAPYDRIVLAILQLAAGDVDQLTHFAAAAKADWRDVLYWTEHPAGPDEPKSWEELKQRLNLPEQ